MHIFGAMIWLGGLMFQNAVMVPISQYEGEQAQSAVQKINTRFTGFIWMSAWTIGVTGILMMLLNPQFQWFRYSNNWSIFLALKQIIFILMIFYAFGYARMLSFLNSIAANPVDSETEQLYRHRLNQFRKISIFLGISAILLAAGMVV